MIKYHGGKQSVTEAPIKVGYIYKKGVYNKALKKRWFVLQGTDLKYYKGENLVDGEPAGVIDCKQLKKVELTGKTTIISNKTYYQFTIELKTTKRIYELYCETHGESSTWVRVIGLLNAQEGEKTMSQMS